MAVQTITTVLVPAASYALTSLETTKDELGLGAATNDDAFLARAITQVSVKIGHYCNRVFAVETVEDRILIDRDRHPDQVPGRVRELLASRSPIIAMISFSLDVVALIEGSDYLTDQGAGIWRRIGDGGYPIEWPARPITATYQAGYAAIPPDLEEATLRLVTARYAARGRDPLLRSEGDPALGQQSWWAGDIPDGIKEILDHYRTPVVA